MMKRILIALLLPSLALAASGKRVGVNPAPQITGNGSSVSVTATGSTTPRTLTVRFADSWIVTDFGAACDATSALVGTDDTAAIQLALNKARDSRIKKVRIPASTIISSALVIHAGTWLEVDPAATVYFSAATGNMLENAAVDTPATRDTNITVTGGTWARGAAAGTGNGLHTLLFRRIDGLTIRDVKVTSSAGKYAISTADITNLHAERLQFDTDSDGIHVSGPASGIVVRDVSGHTGDDSVALTGVDYAAYADTTGSISNVLVDGISSTADTSLFKLVGGTGVTVRNVQVKNLTGLGTGAVVSVIDDTTGPTDVSGLVIDTVEAASPGVGVKLRPTVGGDVILRNVKASYAAAPPVLIEFGGSWELGMVDGLSVATAPANVDLVRVTLGSTIDDLSISNAQILFGGTANANVVSAYGTIGRLRLANMAVVGGRCVLNYVAGSTVGPVTATNLSIKGINRFANFLTAADVTLSGVAIDSPLNPIIYTSGAAVTVRGSGLARVTAWTGLTRAGAEVVHSLNPDFPVDVTALTQTAGDRAWNTNGALALGVGPVASDGTTWHRTGEDRWTVVTVSGGAAQTPSIEARTTRYSVDDGTAFAINAPATLRAGRIFSVQIRNNTAGAITGPTWAAAYKFAGAAAPAAPAANRHTTITFVSDATVVHEIGRAADVPN